MGYKYFLDSEFFVIYWQLNNFQICIEEGTGENNSLPLCRGPLVYRSEYRVAQGSKGDFFPR